MTNSREAFFQRVREAVRQGNRVGHIPGLPERGTVGYQGAGEDPLARLRQEWTAAGGQFHLASTPQEVRSIVRHLVVTKEARCVLVGDELDYLDLEKNLLDCEIIRVGSLPSGTEREVFFRADVGISAVTAILAETGSLVLATRPDQPRSLSLLPPIHLAIARRDQLVADLFDLLDGSTPMPACLTLITGPSKTGDIELKLVTGVHGPGEVHLIVLSGEDD